MNYNIDFDKLINSLLPVFMRKTKQLDWLRSLLAPVKSKHQEFMDFVDEVDDRLSWNGQTISLLHLLITRYGPGFQVINKSQSVRPAHIYPNNDRRNLHFFGLNNLGNPIIYDANRFDSTEVDFVVKVPPHVPLTGEGGKEIEIRTLINRYKLYTKSFKVEEL